MKKWTLAERAQAIYIRRRDLGVLSDLAYRNGNTRRPRREPSASCPMGKCIQNSGRLRAVFRFPDCPVVLLENADRPRPGKRDHPTTAVYAQGGRLRTGLSQPVCELTGKQFHRVCVLGPQNSLLVQESNCPICRLARFFGTDVFGGDGRKKVIWKLGRKRH